MAKRARARPGKPAQKAGSAGGSPGVKRAVARVEPAFVLPMAPTPVTSLPVPGVEVWKDEDWIYEPKVDGDRTFVLVRDGAVKLLSRNNKDVTRTYPGLVAQAQRIDARNAMLDGEIAAVDDTGRVSFQVLRHRSSHTQDAIRFYGFDLLVHNGKDLKSLPIEIRRAKLEAVLARSGLGMTVELPGSPTQALARASQFGFDEGLVAKRRGSLYIPPPTSHARSPNWLKWQIKNQQEFVVGGFARDGASVYELIVGYYDDARQLHFAGKVKDGFVAHDRKTLFRLLEPLHISKCPFVDLPTTARASSQWGGGIAAAEMHTLDWVRPVLVVQIRFRQWTREGRLRLSAYAGVRRDKAAEDVRRE